MKTVITYGTYDLFHIGHLRLLKRAAALGDYLIVAVSSDEFNAIKGKKCEIKDIDKGKDIWMIFLPTNTEDHAILKINSMIQKIEN